MSAALAWILLVVAGLFEVAWAIGLKYTEGFTTPDLMHANALLQSLA